MGETARPAWEGAVIAGIAAATLSGIYWSFWTQPQLMPEIGILYGDRGAVAGWIAHLMHGVAFAVLYAGLTFYTGLSRWARNPLTGWTIGLAYGLILWAFAMGYLYVWWLEAVGWHSRSTPFLTAETLLGHLFYGLTLGTLHPIMVATDARSILADPSE